MVQGFAWKFMVTLSDVPPTGAEFELVPDDEARALLAERAGVHAVVRLRALLNVEREGATGASVEGTLDAVVTQTCVVTLESFDNEIHEAVSLRFEPAETIAARPPQSEEIAGEDPPEPIVDGKLDLAAAVAEFLTLAIDPYPRKPGAVFSSPDASDETDEASPFAALSKLKNKTSKKR